MYCVLYKPFTTIMFWESDAGERTLVLSCSTLHRDTFVSMFWCFYCRLRGTWQAEGFVDMIFLSKGWRLHWNYRVKRPPIRHCILHSSCRKCLSSHASYCLEPQWDMTPDDVMTKQHFFFSFSNYLWLLLKRWMKTRASSRDCDVCALNFTECLIWIGLTMTFSLKITALVEYVFLNTVDHACTLLEYVKVLSRGKWSKNCTASLWKLWLRQDFVLVIPVWKQPGVNFHWVD